MGTLWGGAPKEHGGGCVCLCVLWRGLVSSSLTLCCVGMGPGMQPSLGSTSAVLLGLRMEDMFLFP